jgi:hypothetical protein
LRIFVAVVFDLQQVLPDIPACHLAAPNTGGVPESRRNLIRPSRGGGPWQRLPIASRMVAV